MIRLRPAFTLLLFIAACSPAPPKPEGREMSAEEVAAELAKIEIEPGRWETSREIVRIQAPGMPQEIVAGLRGRTDTAVQCITPDQAQRPSANFLVGQQGSECSYRDFSMEGARLRGTAICSGGGMPGTRTVTMDGVYRPDSYNVRVEVIATEIADGASMTMEARQTGQRSGECAE
jgi:hypothetical protein